MRCHIFSWQVEELRTTHGPGVDARDSEPKRDAFSIERVLAGQFDWVCQRIATDDTVLVCLCASRRDQPVEKLGASWHRGVRGA